MKKLMIIAMSISTLFGSVKATAADQGISTDYFAMEGKMQAAEFDMIASSIRTQIKELNNMQQELANDEDSQGMIKAIGQTIHIASLDLNTARRNFDFESAKKINLNLAETIRNFKSMDPRNEIVGLHPVDGLGE